MARVLRITSILIASLLLAIPANSRATGAPSQAFISLVNNSVGTTVTYISPVTGRANTSTTEAQKQITFNTAGVLSKISIRISSNSATGTSTFRSRVNGANGNQSVSIASGATGTFTATQIDAISPGDEFAMSIAAGTSGGLGIETVSYVFTANSTTATLIGESSSLGQSAASVTRFYKFGANAGGGISTEANARSAFPVAGTLKNFYIFVSANARLNDTVYRTRINGSNGNISITVPATTTGVFEDTSNTDTIAAGDLVGWSQTTGTGTQSITQTTTSIEFDSSASNSVQFANGASGLTLDFGESFITPFGFSSTINQSETKVTVPSAISNLWLRSSSNTTASDSTICVRINGSCSAVSVTLPAGTTGAFTDTTHRVVLAVGDDVDFSFANSSASGAFTIDGVSVLLNGPSLVFPALFYAP